MRDLSCGDMRIYLQFKVRRVQCRRCGKVKRERLAFLADNPFYTKRFAHYVGRRCRSTMIEDLAQELHLDWDTIKSLEKQTMQAQLTKAGTPGPKTIVSAPSTPYVQSADCRMMAGMGMPAGARPSAGSRVGPG